SAISWPGIVGACNTLRHHQWLCIGYILLICTIGNMKEKNMKKIFQFCCLLCLSLAQPLFAQDEAALQTEFVFTIKAGIDDMIPLGETSDGERRAIPITGGSFAGEGISGEVIPGGADYQLVRPDGVV